MLGTSMPDSTSRPADELRFRKRFFYVGCFANILLFALLIAICVVFLFAVAQTFDRSPAAIDETAIKSVISNQAAAWNRGELDAFMDGYWRDEKLTFTAGDEVEFGWEATKDRYFKKYKDGGKDMGKLSFEKLEVENLGPNVALVRGRFVLVLGTEKKTGRFTLVFRKFAEGWKITSDHTSAAEQK